MANVVFENYTIEVQNALDATVMAALEEGAGEMESAVKRRSRVDTGQTKNSFRHHVSPAIYTAHIGSNDDNAIYEEFGTGEYAINGGGRLGGWTYHSKKDDKFYHTHGKRPSRAFFKAYTDKKQAIIKLIQSHFKGL